MSNIELTIYFDLLIAYLLTSKRITDLNIDEILLLIQQLNAGDNIATREAFIVNVVIERSRRNEEIPIIIHEVISASANNSPSQYILSRVVKERLADIFIKDFVHIFGTAMNENKIEPLIWIVMISDIANTNRIKTICPNERALICQQLKQNMPAASGKMLSYYSDIIDALQNNKEIPVFSISPM